MARSRFKLGLLLGSAALVLLPVAANAQATATAPSDSTAAATLAQGAQGTQKPATADNSSPAEAEVSEVVVTGSRIARPEFKAPNPIISFNSAAISESGNTNITNFLVRVPALTGSKDFTQSSGGNSVFSQPFGGAGLNELNLRNLGINRTLVLVDGRRHVAGTYDSAAVDINSIPTDLIERVDVLTSGASAIYGADGVSGVVNFIMKRDFEGLSFRTQNGLSGHGDAANNFVSVTAGKNFADGRGNVTVAYEFNHDGALANDDRSYLRGANRQYLVNNPARDADPTGPAPAQILIGDLHYSFESPIGGVDVNGDGKFDFNGLGQPYRTGIPNSSGYTVGPSDDTPVAGFYSGDLAPEILRHDINLIGHYDFSDAAKLTLEGKFVQVDAQTSDYFNDVFGVPIALDNPFLPATIRDANLAARAAAQAAALPGTDPVLPTISVNRGNIDYGRHGEDDRRRTYRFVGDLSGKISDHAHYDAYYEYGQTDVRFTKINEINSPKYLDAIDAVTSPTTGAPVCRSGNAGCIPISLFGPGPLTAQQLAYFQIDDVSNSTINQHVANASISGDFGQFFRLPGGPVQFSFGGEYRREESEFTPSQNFIAGILQSQANYNEPLGVQSSGGHFDVKEAFGELNAPIFDHQPFAEALSVGAAYRYSDYSTVGSTNTWQFNGIYAPVHDISFRTSYGKAVRAPNITELFQPSNGVSDFVTDPCTPAEINHGTQYRAANCTAQLASVGAVSNPGLQTGNFVPGVTAGNAGLVAEEATTWTAGVVLRPRWIPNFVISFDWYDIDLQNAIATAGGGGLFNLCVDQPTLNNVFCSDVTRQQGTGRALSYITRPENVASFHTSGLDFNADYLLRMDRLGAIDFRLVGGYLDNLDQIALPGAPVTNNRNQFGRPIWNLNFSPTWTIGNVTLAYNFRWFDRTRTQSKQTTDTDPNYAPEDQLFYSALNQHDIQISYRATGGLTLYAGAQNLTDQRPDPGNSINAPVSAVGRYFYLGLKFNLGGRHG